LIKWCGASGRGVESFLGTSPNSLAKQTRTAAVINDVISVKKEGYLDYRVIVTNPDTSGIVIKMIVCAGTVTDADGNVYQSVKIGNQIWTTENYRSTKYNDGSPIPCATAGTAWGALATGAYCNYNNTADAGAVKKYGALYNWYAVKQAKFAPAGWRVPTDKEWEAMEFYLEAAGYNWDGTTIGNKMAKALAAKADWGPYQIPGNIGCDLIKNNGTGFSGLPGGYRLFDGTFDLFGTQGYWWTSTVTEDWTYNAYFWRLYREYEGMGRNYNHQRCGFSVRFIKN
jgi:uncharacterized protein (TIGR02145 family)